jgi:hypothetical protein
MAQYRLQLENRSRGPLRAKAVRLVFEVAPRAPNAVSDHYVIGANDPSRKKLEASG